jgi:hypothetical protein
MAGGFACPTGSLSARWSSSSAAPWWPLDPRGPRTWRPADERPSRARPAMVRTATRASRGCRHSPGSRRSSRTGSSSSFATDVAKIPRCRPWRRISPTRTWRTWPPTTPPSCQGAPQPERSHQGRRRPAASRGVSLHVLSPARPRRARANTPPGRPGSGLSPEAPSRLQGPDGLGPRWHDDHGRAASQRGGHRKPGTLHGEHGVRSLIVLTGNH